MGKRTRCFAYISVGQPSNRASPPLDQGNIPLWHGDQADASNNRSVGICTRLDCLSPPPFGRQLDRSFHGPTRNDIIASQRAIDHTIVALRPAPAAGCSVSHAVRGGTSGRCFRYLPLGTSSGTCSKRRRSSTFCRYRYVRL